ncbi:cell division protein FtsL, partial [Acidisoma sp. C75]
MIRPFTCICLMLAAGSGLYLYQVKQRAFKLEAELRTTFHDIDVAREKTRMLRADWALMNDPERLQTLAAQYLTLKPMAPAQLMTLDQLAAVLPPPEAPGTEHPP